MLLRALLATTAVAVVGADLLQAQSNVIAGRDLRLETANTITRYRRSGTFPTGVQAIGIRTTCCNPGVGAIPFQAAMQATHGFIHYIVARESDGRLVQISNYAWIKHTFGSNNDPGACGACPTGTTTSFVEPGCSDTYLASQSVDHFNLGPPSELDPWLGSWNPICSYFDRGNPEVAVAQQCDGIRSVTQSQASVLNQQIGLTMRVYDDDLNVPGAAFCYQAGYLVPGEADALRGDNIGSRAFTAAWNAGAGQWTIADSGGFLAGSILQRWTGATLTSNGNGNDDGRYYVAVKVTGPTNGLYHYEYAVHNRDNGRGAGSLRIPVCAGARVLNLGFHDVDRDALTDWSVAVAGNEIVFQTTALHPNPLRWNSIYNFWFDSDAAPVAGSVQLDQYAFGPGAMVVAVPTSTPSGVYNQHLGAGCGSPNAPTLFATGTPDRALLGNTTFALQSRQNPASALCALYLATAAGTTPLGGGCTAYTADVATLLGPVVTAADATGAGTVPLAIPNDPALEGIDLDFQWLAVQTGGALLGVFNASNGLRVRVGNLIAGCP